jgi:hypothetical protein
MRATRISQTQLRPQQSESGKNPAACLFAQNKFIINKKIHNNVKYVSCFLFHIFFAQIRFHCMHFPLLTVQHITLWASRRLVPGVHQHRRPILFVPLIDWQSGCGPEKPVQPQGTRQSEWSTRILMPLLLPAANLREGHKQGDRVSESFCQNTGKGVR